MVSEGWTPLIILCVLRERDRLVASDLDGRVFKLCQGRKFDRDQPASLIQV